MPWPRSTRTMPTSKCSTRRRPLAPTAVVRGCRSRPAPPPKKRRGRRFLLMVALPLAARRRRRLCLGDRRPLSGHRKRQSAPGQGVDRLGVRPAASSRSTSPTTSWSRAATCCSRSIREPYRIALAQADAAVAAHGSTSSSCAPPTARPWPRSRSAASEVDFAKSQFDRAKPTSPARASTPSRALDQARTTSHKAQAASQVAAQQGIVSARAALGGNPDIATDKHPAVLAALAARDKAAYDLAQTHGPGARRRHRLAGLVLQESAST